MASTRPDKTERFAWPECRAVIALLDARFGLVADDKGRRLCGADETHRVEVEPPLVLPGPEPGQAAPAWVGGLPERIGRQLVLLIQAGATAAGLWDDDVLRRHKNIKKYVVRGKGRAQPTHLRTRGKSRYGSRLRLRNAAALVEETNELLARWWAEEGAPDRIFLSVPVRIGADLFQARPAPPFEARDPRVVRIPLDVRRPSFEELERVRRFVATGRVRWWTAPPA